MNLEPYLDGVELVVVGGESDKDGRPYKLQTKVLFTDSHYKTISVEAKVLYGLLLDRMALSLRNGWCDSDNRVFIYFTLEDAVELLGCGKPEVLTSENPPL